jgi:Cu+-exporting ATPase
MLNFFASKPKGKSLVLHINGMHCVSCGMNIDGELEDTKGVISSSTNYPKSTTTVLFDEKQILPQQICDIIQGLGYRTEEKKK